MTTHNRTQHMSAGCAHTGVCQCGAAIRAERWPQRSQRMIKAPACHRSLIVSRQFYSPRRLRMWVAGESCWFGRGFGPLCTYSPRLNKQHEVGRRRRGGIDVPPSLFITGWVAPTPGVPMEPLPPSLFHAADVRGPSSHPLVDDPHPEPLRCPGGRADEKSHHARAESAFYRHY